MFECYSRWDSTRRDGSFGVWGSNLQLFKWTSGCLAEGNWWQCFFICVQRHSFAEGRRSPQFWRPLKFLLSPHSWGLRSVRLNNLIVWDYGSLTIYFFLRQSLVYSLAYEFVFNGPIRPLRHISSSDPKNGDVYTIIHFSEKFLPPAIPAKRLKTGRLREDDVCQIFGFSDSFDLHRLRSSVCAKQFCGELFPRVENTFCVELEILNKTKAEDGLRFLYLPLARGMKKYRIEGGAIPFKVEDNYPVFCKNSGEYLFAGFPIYQKMWKRRPYMLVQRMFI